MDNIFINLADVIERLDILKKYIGEVVRIEDVKKDLEEYFGE